MYKVYDVLTNAYLGEYATYTDAQTAHRGQPVTIIYRRGRRKKK